MSTVPNQSENDGTPATGKKGEGRPGLSPPKTSVGESALDEYLREVARHEPIDREEEAALARRARRGEEEAFQKLVGANLRFVISVAKRYQGRGLPLSDLIQAGNLGLVTAAMKFDPERGVKLISYAVWWIRQAIQSALAHHGRSVRLPVNRAAQISRILKTRQQLKEKLGREPSTEEVAKEADIDTDTVEMLESMNAGAVRMDAPIGEDEKSTIRERVLLGEEESPTAATVEQRLLQDEIDRALANLRERDALILRLYYGLGGVPVHTLQEIGDLLEISRERVRQLRDRALNDLRQGGEMEALASFVA